MGWNRTLRAAGAVVLLVANGCTSLREIPRSDYASVSERKNVRLVTRDGLEYEFDFARFSSDSMTGFRQQPIEGVLDNYAIFSLPYGGIQKLSTRRVDWYRTGLIGGGVLAAVVVAGLSTQGTETDSGEGSGGGVRPPGIP